jgi:hypothetical protein
MADSLARILGQLGLERRAKKAPDLTTYLAERYGTVRNDQISREDEQNEINERTPPQGRTE